MNCLVLNTSYEPIQIVNIQKAIKLIVRGVAEIEKESQQTWTTASSVSWTLPSVVRLTNFHKIPKRVYRMSKKNILIRDSYTCQYCKKKANSEASMTLDHVIPKSRGGTSSWDNLVAACNKCNLVKANRTPAEAGMTLLQRSTKSHMLNHRTILRRESEKNTDWHEYLFF